MYKAKTTYYETNDRRRS